MTSPKPAYPFYFLLFPGMTRHPQRAASWKLQPGLSDLHLTGGAGGWRAKWAGPRELRGLFVLEMLSHSAKRSLTHKKKGENANKQWCLEGYYFARQSSFGSSRFLNSEVSTQIWVHVFLWATRFLRRDFPLSSGTSLTLEFGWAVGLRCSDSLAHHYVRVINHQVPSFPATCNSRTEITSLLAFKKAGWNITEIPLGI